MISLPVGDGGSRYLAISDPSMKVFGWVFQQIAANVNIWPLPYLSLADVGPLGMHPMRCVPIASPSSLTHEGMGGGVCYNTDRPKRFCLVRTALNHFKYICVI